MALLPGEKVEQRSGTSGRVSNTFQAKWASRCHVCQRPIKKGTSCHYVGDKLAHGSCTADPRALRGKEAGCTGVSGFGRPGEGA